MSDESIKRFQDFVEEVRNKNPIADVVGESVKVRRFGRYLKCPSPFRQEKDPSFVIYADESWFDYGINIGGDVFAYVQKRDNCDFRTAVDTLAARVGMSWSSGSGPVDPELELEIDNMVERRWVLRLQREIADYQHRCLTPAAREYLNDKCGFTDETIEELRIGWSDGGALDFMVENSATLEKFDVDTKEDRLLATGYFLERANGEISELHEDRIVFPYLRKGMAPYAISRRLEGETPDTNWQKAKYKKSLTHSDKHPYVSKHVSNSVFYGEDSAARSQTVGIITEGVTDAISAWQAGYAVVSPVTTVFRDRDHDKLARLTEKWDLTVIINDNEVPKTDPKTKRVFQPGLDGAIKTANFLFKEGRNVRIALPERPDGVSKVDLNDLVRESTDDEIKKLIDSCRPFPDFLINRISSKIAPEEIDEALFPIYDLIANRPSMEREAYVNIISQKFGISNKCINEGMNEFAKKENLTIPGQGESVPPPAKEEDPDAPKLDFCIHGHIEENTEGSYYYTIQAKGGLKYISNFIMVPTGMINLDHKVVVRCNVKGVRGNVIKDVLVPAAAWTSSRELRKAVVDIHPAFTFTGDDSNVGGLVECLQKYPVPTYQGIKTLGYAETPNGRRWVTHKGIIGPKGFMAEPDTVYSPLLTPAVASMLDYSSVTMPLEDIHKIAREVIPKLMILNEPEVIIPMVAWFAAASVAPIVRRVLGCFPQMFIWGTQGSGKTSMTRDIFLRMYGVIGDLFSASDTQFAMISTLAGADSIPAFFDEFRSTLPEVNKRRVNEFARKNYSGNIEQRGRADRKVDRYPIRTPMGVIGETKPIDPPTLERMICVSPKKNSLTKLRRNLMAYLVANPIEKLVGSWIRFLLNTDVEALLYQARTVLQDQLLPQLKHRPPPRICNNMQVLAFGELLHIEWCRFAGVVIKDRPMLVDYFKKIIANITESEDGGEVKDAFDNFLEYLSTLCRIGVLSEGIHYAVLTNNGDEKRHLSIHLESCYLAYLQHRRSTGMSDETNGLAALKRCAKEKMAQPESYIVTTSHRIRLQSSNEAPGLRHARTIQIDESLIPVHISYDSFPASRTRRSMRYSEPS